MKNTLFLDDTFTPELLENEESDPGSLRNTIWLRFRTTSAANQKLQIMIRSVTYEIELTPSTDYNYQLEGLYWATGTSSAIRLVCTGFTSEYIYILFPEIISSDAALQEVENESREYQILEKTSEAIELKNETIAYRNGREYNLDTLTKIVQLVFSCTQARTNALLTLTLTVTFTGITDEALARFHLRKNLVLDEVFIPTQTVKNGIYIITICYPVENVSSSDRNQVDVYMEVSDGSAQILQGNAIATLTGSSIAVSNKFTGLIECIEIVRPITIPDDFGFAALTDSVDISLRVPVSATLADNVNVIQIPEPSVQENITDRIRVINYELDQQRVLEDEETERVTENGTDYRYTEREHS